MKRAFTLIELLIIIAIIGILAAFIISNLGSSRSLSQDAVRKNDISNLYKSIVGKNALSESSYPDIVSTIEPEKTNSNLQSFIDQFLKTTPYDPNPTKAYLYKGNGKDFSIAAILDDGSCFIKSTGINLFGSDSICSAYSEGGIGLVQNFSLLHGNTYIDLVWSIPSSLAALPSTDVSSAIICLDSPDELDTNSLPSDEELIGNGKIVAIVNNAYNQYRLLPEDPDHYYYCKTYSYDETVVTNPGTPGSAPNTSSGGFSPSASSSYSSSSPSSYTPSSSSNPPSIGGSTSTGGSSSPSFTTSPIRNPDGTGSITLSWNPGALSTHTIIRRMDNVPPTTSAPGSLTEGTQVYNERNDKDSQDPTAVHTHTDTGLGENTIYCYSAWAYDERTDTYSNGFVLACGGIPPSDPSSQSLTATTSSFTLAYTKGSASNTVIRRAIDTPPSDQEEGTLVYNSTGSSFTDNDPSLEKDTTYCYSIWSYNPNTAALSTNHVSSCGTLSNMAAPTNLTFPTVAYNSIILNWNRGTGSTKTYIVRKQGSIPANKDDGTPIYEDTGNAFIDTGLITNTQYCYAAYATDGTDYTEAVTGCATTISSGLVFNQSSDTNYLIDKFTLPAGATASGIFTWTAPPGVTSIQYLIVGGGGSGGRRDDYASGGGGGAGGLLAGTVSVVPGQSYGIEVGVGGAVPGGATSAGISGGISKFNTLIAAGGGAGAGKGASAVGGSGGGGAGWSVTAGSAGTSGQGNSGGSGDTYNGAGGGGAGGAGNNGNGTKVGGIGIQSSITGTAVYYAGGGGGGSAPSYGKGAGAGGNGGGGAGGVAGTNGLGGGGGGGHQLSASSGAGGSGIVIIRYWNPSIVGNGACGTANNKTYAMDSVSFGSDTLCSVGLPDPLGVSFPVQGSSVSWICRGYNGGVDANCSAARTAAFSQWEFEGTTAAGSYALSADVLDTWNNNNGTISSPAPIVRGGADCFSGKCLEFDGTNYVQVPDSTTLSAITTTLSI